MSKKVTALFVMRDSVYKKIGIESYDKDRDATTYIGNNRVIAHPPCQLWGKMATVNYKRWGGEHNRPGNDKGCFRFAIQTVNRCGGVLEHPAESYAWSLHGLLHPTSYPGWIKSGLGWVCEVWQSAYGHKARKRTWLYFRGSRKPIDPIWDRISGTHQVGHQDHRGKSKNKPTLTKRESNHTPESFARFLLELAIQ